MWVQKQFSIPAKRRGFHLITADVLTQLPELSQLHIGLMHLFIQHTSASLTLNENADPDVRSDMETAFNWLVPEGVMPLVHTLEGPDDMPAHIKASLLGSSLTIPVAQGKLAMGTWQGIYLCEHRNHGAARHFVATLLGTASSTER